MVSFQEATLTVLLAIANYLRHLVANSSMQLYIEQETYQAVIANVKHDERLLLTIWERSESVCTLLLVRWC